jgi:hypothetical protein
MPPHSVVVLEVSGKQNIPNNAINIKNIAPGLQCKVYKGTWTKLPDFNTLTPFKEDVVSEIKIPDGIVGNNFGLEFNGYIKIDKEGMYNFMLTSDDGSKLLIDDNEIIDNDGCHAMIEQQGSALLSKGYHLFKLLFFQRGDGSGLKTSVGYGGEEFSEFPKQMFSHSVK